MSESFGKSAEELSRRLSKAQMLDMLAKLIVKVNQDPDMDAVQERNSRSEAASVQ